MQSQTRLFSAWVAEQHWCRQHAQGQELSSQAVVALSAQGLLACWSDCFSAVTFALAGVISMEGHKVANHLMTHCQQQQH